MGQTQDSTKLGILYTTVILSYMISQHEIIKLFLDLWYNLLINLNYKLKIKKNKIAKKILNLYFELRGPKIPK